MDNSNLVMSNIKIFVILKYVVYIVKLELGIYSKNIQMFMISFVSQTVMICLILKV